jgi:Fe-S cluster biogenesis protein NfuA
MATEQQTAGGPEALAARVQELTEALEQIPDGFARAIAEDLAGALMALYGEGLERMMSALDDAGDTGAALRGRFEEDGVISSLLLIHDLYPVPLGDRVQEALDSVRPYMESHGGNVDLLSLDGGIARIALEGSCKSCAASASTLELAIKRALDEHAPDLLGLEVEGMDAAPAGFGPGNGNGGMALPMAGSLPTWHAVTGEALAPGTLSTRTVAGRRLVVANVGGSLLAYQDACAGCGSALDTGTLVGGVLSCPACGARFDLQRAGITVDGVGPQLEPVPLLTDESGEVRVAVGA